MGSAATKTPVPLRARAGGDVLVEAVRRLSLARGMSEVVDVVRESARRLTGADGVTFVLRDGELVHYVDEDAIGPLWKGQRFPMSACISGWVIANRTPAVVEDIYSDARIPLAAYQPTFVRSLAMVPIRREEPLGAIGAYWATRRRATPREVEALEALAGAASLAVANVELYEAARRATRARDEFIGLASHELRTPLSPLELRLGALRRAVDRGADRETIRGELDRLGEHFERVKQLVELLLDVAQLDREPLPVVTGPVDLRAAVDAAVERLRRHARPEQRVSVSGEAAVEGRWDRRWLDRALASLVSNALKFGGDAPVEVVVEASPALARVRVRDRGVGVDAADVERIFDRFERAASPREFAGLGVGLWMVRRVAEAHRGAVRVAPRADGGSEFVLELPRG